MPPEMRAWRVWPFIHSITMNGWPSCSPMSYSVPISYQLFRDEFEGDVAAKTRVVSAVHDAHTAGADLVHHSIMRNCFADHAQGLPCDRSPRRDDTRGETE